MSLINIDTSVLEAAPRKCDTQIFYDGNGVTYTDSMLLLKLAHLYETGHFICEGDENISVLRIQSILYGGQDGIAIDKTGSSGTANAFSIDAEVNNAPALLSPIVNTNFDPQTLLSQISIENGDTVEATMYETANPLNASIDAIIIPTPDIEENFVRGDVYELLLQNATPDNGHALFEYSEIYAGFVISDSLGLSTPLQFGVKWHENAFTVESGAVPTFITILPAGTPDNAACTITADLNAMTAAGYDAIEGNVIVSHVYTDGVMIAARTETLTKFENNESVVIIDNSGLFLTLCDAGLFRFGGIGFNNIDLTAYGGGIVPVASNANIIAAFLGLGITIYIVSGACPEIKIINYAPAATNIPATA